MSSSAKRAVWSVVQIIAGVALMMQSYLVTEDDNKRLNSDQKVFKWLVAVLACAIKGKRWRGYGFAVIEVIEVSDVLTFLLIIIISIPLPSHSVIPGLKPSFSANTSHPSPFLFFFRTDSERIRFFNF